jgi:hypothetical protein
MEMKKVAALLVSALIVCVVGLPVLASETAAAAKSHDMTVEFVSFDAKAKTLTFKDDKGATKTAPVMDTAMTSFTNVKAGDKVTITCADDEHGHHQGVSAAKPAKMAKTA